ncbi:MAG: hypothetical protein ACREEM_03285 [Blastocatellia bacterium]
MNGEKAAVTFLKQLRPQDSAMVVAFDYAGWTLYFLSFAGRRAARLRLDALPGSRGHSLGRQLRRRAVQTFDVWRYRVYGVSSTGQNGQPSNVFYEVVLPGPTLNFDGGGLDLDWYQPTYENGNILSYPQPSSGTFMPSDLGSHNEPCPSNPPPGQSCNPDGTIPAGVGFAPVFQPVSFSRA